MEKIKIFSMKSPYREPFHINGFLFGKGEKSVAIVGAMRGDEIQQQFVCSQIVRLLCDFEQKGLLRKDFQILVIPSVNHFSMNINKRFWPMDNTDINRMFPGYNEGETTQRIASAVFEAIKDYRYGIQLASYHFPGEFVPHVRIIKTFTDITDDAQKFGLPYVYLKTPEPFDTVMLNYNWQVWNSAAYSIYAGTTDTIDKKDAHLTWNAVMRFLSQIGIITKDYHGGYLSRMLNDADFQTVMAGRAGFFYKLKTAGAEVRQDELIAKILDTFNGSVLSEIHSPSDGVIFFAHSKALIMQYTAAFQVIGW